MSRRDKDKKASLDALAKFAYAAGGGAPAPAPRAPTPAPRPVAPKPAGKPASPARADPAAERARRKQMEERKAKLEEERALRERRAGELMRGATAPWRGSGFRDIPSSIYRTGFDRDEPTVSQKLNDILGDARQKESREKARAKGKRAGGKR